jgi:hypothetical protein
VSNPVQHDNNLPPVISALGLWNTSRVPGVYPLSHTTPNPLHQFRASYLVAFRGYVALERLACSATRDTEETVHVAGAPPANVSTSKYIRVRVRTSIAHARPGINSHRLTARRSRFPGAPLAPVPPVRWRSSRPTSTRRARRPQGISCSGAVCRTWPTQQERLHSSLLHRQTSKRFSWASIEYSRYLSDTFVTRQFSFHPRVAGVYVAPSPYLREMVQESSKGIQFDVARYNNK